MVQMIEDNLGSITLLLALGTFWMAVSTRAAATASRKIFELESRPYLVFSKPMFRFYVRMRKDDPDEPESQTLRLGLEFWNSGRVPLRYTVSRVHMTFDSRSVEEPGFVTKGGVVYPGDFGVFWIGEFPYNEELAPPKKGIVEYKLTYESIDHARQYSKSERMEYMVNSFELYSVDWRYLEDSEEVAL